MRNRDFLLFLAILLGLLAGEGARWTENIVIPALAAVMTLSTMGIPGSIFRSPRTLVVPALVGLAMNFGILSSLIWGLNILLIQEESLSTGFIIMVAVPPAIAVIPFSALLNGSVNFSLIATIGCYLGALAVTPAIAVGLLGSGFIDPWKLMTIMAELILLPLVLSRVLRRSGLSNRIDPFKGAVTNWGFFLVTYTIVGLNRAVFLNRPLSLLPAAAIAVASTFLLGYGIERAGRLFRLDSKMTTSLVLLGTQKNTGLAAGLALTLFSEKTAVPATVTTIFMIVHMIWLSLKMRQSRD